ncbi:MAG: hypothetical protein KDD53_08040, partial [Bdellovibrionales bacterium]|nr:hypothetical protein [Bdellovibrionales bacterium]
KRIANEKQKQILFYSLDLVKDAIKTKKRIKRIRLKKRKVRACRDSSSSQDFLDRIPNVQYANSSFIIDSSIPSEIFDFSVEPKVGENAFGPVYNITLLGKGFSAATMLQFTFPETGESVITYANYISGGEDALDALSVLVNSPADDVYEFPVVIKAFEVGKGKKVSNEITLLVVSGDTSNPDNGPNETEDGDEVCSPKPLLPSQTIFFAVNPLVNDNYVIPVTASNLFGTGDSSGLSTVLYQGELNGPYIEFPYAKIAADGSLSFEIPKEAAITIELGLAVANIVDGKACISKPANFSFFAPPVSNGTESGIDLSGGVSSQFIVQEARPNDAQSVARPDAVFTFGVPFPKGTVAQIGGRPQVGIVNSSDQEVVHQARTLSSWDDGSVQWALLDGQIDLPVNTQLTGLRLVSGSGVSTQPNLAQETPSSIGINTGPLVATVEKGSNFAFLSYVAVNGKNLVLEGNTEFGRTLNNQPLTPGSSTVVSIKENGPVRAVIVAEGPLVDSSSNRVIDFTLKMTFRRNDPGVDTDFTVRNARNAYNQHVKVKNLGLRLSSALSGTLQVKTPNINDGSYSTSLSSGSNLYLHQAYNKKIPTEGSVDLYGNYLPHAPGCPYTYTNESGNSVKAYATLDKGFRIVKNGSIVIEGTESNNFRHGYVSLSDGNGNGVTIVGRDMAGLFPSAIKVQAASSGAQVEFAPYPDTNIVDYSLAPPTIPDG